MTRVVIVEDEKLMVIGTYTGPKKKGTELEFAEEEYKSEEIQRLLKEKRIKDKISR